MSGKPAKGFQAMDQEHNALQFFCFILAKGQLISKGNFSVFNSPKKRT